ncbi:MaoC family dehydratase N-terminal domain-containing protein [Streptomyces sp. NPDC052196]|uniref:FAS1-like dehydratase domain-containing protein n=1 Tax=Streptomyces sp. NPDC052196 TaxID=3156691 RepID=UPI00341861CE
MVLDQCFVGKSCPPTAPYEVGREKIREFASAIGDTNPAYVDVIAARDLGHPDVIAPPTFAFVITFEAEGRIVHDPGLGLDYDRVVHNAQKFLYVRAIRAGDRLIVTSTIERIRALAGNDVLDVRSEVHDESGGLVVTAWASLVSRAGTTR